MIDYNFVITKWRDLKDKGYSNSHLEVKDIQPKGLGVFARKDIAKGDIIEYSHAMVYGKDGIGWINCSNKECKMHGVEKITPTGFGSIYNSADSEEEQNMKNFCFFDDRLIIYVAIKDIKAGSEILNWWGNEYYDTWCKPRRKKWM